ncbi:hypothetical protein [Aminobacter sp. J44]|uniref:hypothetical protein n=1 Tax=Aminobacter sp. J44 TaxID=935262 RepID=UPI00119A4EA8|nr:hypothetical protein [Aminobacter sp. J44]TWG49860.1 hypothetical protein L610_006200000050 [Aminobacter sp. J44]TWG55032.1 hypothetical protein L610_003900000020 [Aminobacter sp. J44]
MRNDTAATEFEKRLETARKEGAAGREELLHKLARMPMDKVISLPASSLALLGPHGLAQLAAMREGLAGVAPRTVAATVRPQPEKGGKLKSVATVRPIRSALMMVVSIIAIGLAVDLAQPLLVSAFLDPGTRPRETSRWPACPRLDAHVDGCVYVTGGGTLSLRRVASLTGIAVDQVTGANRHISAASETALPRGSQVVIWRGRLKLSGAPQ